MNSTLQAEWRVLKRGTPGHRFRDSYEHSRHAVDRMSAVGRAVRIGLAAVAVAIGIVLVFIPGPAILFFAIGGALLAAESRAVARILDWLELRMRALARWGLRQWCRLPLPGKIATAILTVAIAASAGLLSYHVLFG